MSDISFGLYKSDELANVVSETKVLDNRIEDKRAVGTKSFPPGYRDKW